MFCHLVDSTALQARLGDDGKEAVRRRHVADVSDAVDAAEPIVDGDDLHGMPIEPATIWKEVTM